MSKTNATILIVEDDGDIQEVLAEVLRDLGYEVVCARHGAAALEYLHENPHPCLILLDWTMPQCDGAAFRAEQLKDPTIADIPVVLLTGDRDVRKMATDLGLSGGLMKPLKLESLVAEVRKHCS